MTKRGTKKEQKIMKLLQKNSNFAERTGSCSSVHFGNRYHASIITKLVAPKRGKTQKPGAEHSNYTFMQLEYSAFNLTRYMCLTQNVNLGVKVPSLETDTSISITHN